MKPPAVLALPLLLLACLPGAVVAESAGVLRVSEVHRSELRHAVDAHRAARRAEAQREEAAASRRLTAAELAELRQQVREQWMPRSAPVHSANSAESQPAQRLMPAAQATGDEMSTAASAGPRP